MKPNQLNHLLLNSSSDVIVNLSIGWKILEFNSAAEDFFGVKRDEVINQNYLDLFIPESLRHKTEQQLNQLLELASQNKIIMKVKGAGGDEMETEWTVNSFSTV